MKDRDFVVVVVEGTEKKGGEGIKGEGEVS